MLTRFGDYSPGNFRNTYAGQLLVREALFQPQNIPSGAVLETGWTGRVASAAARGRSAATLNTPTPARLCHWRGGSVRPWRNWRCCTPASPAAVGSRLVIPRRPYRAGLVIVDGDRLLVSGTTSCAVRRYRQNVAPGQRRPATFHRPQAPAPPGFRDAWAGLRRRLHRRRHGSDGRTARPAPVTTVAIPPRRCCSVFDLLPEPTTSPAPPPANVLRVVAANSCRNVALFPAPPGAGDSQRATTRHQLPGDGHHGGIIGA